MHGDAKSVASNFSLNYGTNVELNSIAVYEKTVKIHYSNINKWLHFSFALQYLLSAYEIQCFN